MKEITLTSDLKLFSSQPDGPWQAGAGGFAKNICHVFGKTLENSFGPKCHRQPGGGDPPPAGAKAQFNIKSVFPYNMCLKI